MMYYLKIGKLWISDVKENSYYASEHMLHGWSNEDDAIDAAKMAAKVSDRDVLLLKLEVIRSVEAD